MCMVLEVRWSTGNDGLMAQYSMQDNVQDESWMNG